MKVITIESSAYRAMTEQIAEIADYVRRSMDTGRQEPSDRKIDTDGAARMLGVSRRTLQRMRSEHRIKYIILRGKCGYRLSEINRLLDASTDRRRVLIQYQPAQHVYNEDNQIRNVYLLVAYLYI